MKMNKAIKNTMAILFLINIILPITNGNWASMCNAASALIILLGFVESKND